MQFLFKQKVLIQYSGPCDLRPLYLTIPCILRPDISDTTCVYFQYKYPSILRPPSIYDHILLAEWAVLNHRDHCSTIMLCTSTNRVTVKSVNICPCIDQYMYWRLNQIHVHVNICTKSANIKSGMQYLHSRTKMDKMDMSKEYEKRKADGKDNINLVVIGNYIQ